MKPALAAFAAAVICLAESAPATAQKGALVPSGSSGSEGVSGPAGTPSGDARYVTLWNDAGETTVLRIATDGGRVEQQARIDGTWSPPAVTLSGDAGGLSADGRTLVLVEPAYGVPSRHTEFLVLDTERLRISRHDSLPGSYSFDAISPDGGLMYLIEYPHPRNPLDYAVRTYDVRRSKLLPGKIVDPDEPGEQMTGRPVSRRMSADGRWAYTLYTGGDAPFVHALDTEGRTAQCIDLDHLGVTPSSKPKLSLDPDSGELTISRQATPVATIDPHTFAVSAATPAASATDGSPAVGSSRGWLGAVAIAAGAALAIAALAIVLRRRRHGRALA